MDQNRPRRDLDALLADLSGVELDYVWARSRVATDKAAFQEAGVPKSSFYKWPEERRVHLGEVADDLRRNRVIQAQYELGQAVADAARELVSLTKERNKNIRIRAVEGVLDRVLGKAVQRNEHTGAEGGPLVVAIGGIDPDEDI